MGSTWSLAHILCFLLTFFRLLSIGLGKDVDVTLDLNVDPTLEIESQDLVKVFQDELQGLRMDLTKSFIAGHSRMKREILKYSYEASLNSIGKDTFETRLDSSGGYSSSIYKNQTYVFQNDGIYRLDGLRTSNQIESLSSTPNLVKVTPWILYRGERILTTQEWEGNLFILTANQDGSYSKLYTLHDLGNTLTLRQQIRNQGYATAATFFVHSYDLYLVIATDNVAHSLTITPIYRWSRTYMDQIHEIQTRGAVTVISFTVSSYTYVAIAQSEDAAGNYEVGTLVVRVYGNGELEKVQLLWSIEPVSLAYVRFLEEHFLVIGQKKESSICYWFGGYQFVFWQSLEGLVGSSVFLDSLLLPDREPLLLGSTETTVSLYSRIKNSQVMETSLLNRTSIIFTTSSSSQRIIEARFLKRAVNQDPIVYLALTIQTFSTITLKIYPIVLTKIPIGESQKDPEDKLGRCMTSLRDALDQDDSSLKTIESQNDIILTLSGNWTVKDMLVSQGQVIMDKTKTTIVVANVNPDLTNPEDIYTSVPSSILQNADEKVKEFDLINEKLSQVLFKSKPGNITGNFIFTKPLQIGSLDSSTTIQLETLNDVTWSALENGVLRSDNSRHQTVTGSWEIDTLKTGGIETGNQIGDTLITDFLLTTSENIKRKEVLKGQYTFAQDIEIDSLQISSVNDILFSEIVLQTNQFEEVGGFKSAKFINGGDDLGIELLNGLKLSEWYDSMLKIDGISEEFSTGTKIFSGDLVIDSLQLDLLNRKNWNEFSKSVLVNGKNQTIFGDLTCLQLKTNSLQVKTINNNFVDDWMTTSTNQSISSDIIVGDIKIRQNLSTQSINDIHLSDVVLISEKDVRILGPIELKGITTGNISLTPNIRLNGIDISEAAKLRKKHIYTTVNGEALILSGNVQVGNLKTSTLNSVLIDSIRDTYWRTNANNIIESDFNFGSTKVIVEEDFTTKTLNLMDVEKDLITTTTENELISRKIQFTSDVIVYGKILTPDEITLNGYDISVLEKDIIRINESRRIRGKKEFIDLIEVKAGIQLTEVNGLVLEKELIFLDGSGRQKIFGNKKFQQVEAVVEVISEVDVEVLQGLVNGQDLSRVNENTIYQDLEKIQILSDVIFEQSIEVENFEVNNEINRINFGEIITNLIRLDEAQTLSLPLTITGGTLKFQKSSTVDYINGISPAEYLSQIASSRVDEKFSGIKEFVNVIIDQELICELINNINLTQLEVFGLSKTKDQLITGRLTFQDLQIKGNLQTETICGIAVTDLVRIDQEVAPILTDVIFRSPITKVKGRILLNGLLNNYKIEQVAENLRAIQGNRKFESVTVHGNLSWENSDLTLQRMSYLFENAVTIDSTQTLRGKVIFAKELRVDSVTSSKWINGIDLNKILSDSVNSNNLDSHLTFSGVNTFLNEIEVRLGPVIVIGHLNTPKINNITLRELYKEVVRINSSKSVEGLKIFDFGLSTEKLNVYGEIDSIFPRDLVTINDQRLIDQATMNSVTILKNLNYKTLINYQIQTLLNERVTLTGYQRIYGDLTFQEDLIVKDCKAVSINGLRLSDIFLQNSKNLQKFTGEKRFQNLIINGDIEDTWINGIDLSVFADQTLHLAENETIERHIIFADTVHMEDSVDVIGDVNNFGILQVAEAFTSDLKHIIENVVVTQETKNYTTDLIHALEKSQQNKAVWLEYLELKESWKDVVNSGPTSRIEHFISPYQDDGITFAFHQPNLDTQGKLPSGCVCNSIKFIYHTLSTTEPVQTVNCVNIFDVNSPNGESYTIYSHIVSYNKTCSRRESSLTYISSTPGDNERFKVNLELPVPKTQWTLGTFEIGYIMDVKAFSIENRNFLVIAQYYDHKLATHNAAVLIYETTGSIVIKRQEIEGHGTRRLGLEQINQTWTLVIGNTIGDSSSEELCSTTSAIYIWSLENNEFILLRNIQTEQLVDVAVTEVTKNGYFHEGYVTFAENGADGLFGKISIYQRSAIDSNYLIFQTIEYDSPVSAIYTFSIPQFVYLIVAVPSRGLEFYHFRHIEGFILKLTVPITQALDVNVLVHNKELLFPIASGYDGIRALLAKGILQGKL